MNGLNPILFLSLIACCNTALAQPVSGNEGAAGWIFKKTLGGNSAATSWEWDSEPPGAWGNRRTAAWFDGFMGISGTLQYNNYFDRIFIPGQSVPTSASMEGRFFVKLTWNPGENSIPAPTRMWAKLFAYTEYRLRGNLLGSYGSGSAVTSNANYSGTLFGGSYQMQDRVKKLEFSGGVVTLPTLTLNSGTLPSTYAEYGYLSGDLAYTIYPNPVLKAGNEITYRKGTSPQERLPNTPDGNGRTVEHKAIGIIPIYPYKVLAPTASTKSSLAQSIFSGNNVLYNFTYAGDGSVSNSTPMGVSSSSSKLVDILLPTVPMNGFPNTYGKSSAFNVEADDSSILDYDAVDASTEIKWHFPYENIEEELVNFNYSPLTVVSMDSPGYYFWNSGTLNETLQHVSRYDLMTCTITGYAVTITGIALDLLQLPTLMTFVFSRFGFMDNFEESIQKQYLMNHMPGWGSCWNNISNGSPQDSYPRSSFYPDRTFPQDEYRMVPAPFGKFDGYHVLAEKYSASGYDGQFSQDYAQYIHKDVPVGIFRHEFTGGSGGGWGPGGPI
ncbi:hypothetical protein IQ258_29445 [Coleofasciculus sp. LEGE 07081]|uniref:hypothetical protein n=1 Tax=Coleofasciculus sp. LEGE 07081 TaxID=2777967 RepID=UPI001880CA15|nr:hypothetical protein [Coleofasciculus sp. LEGE 07081]MBE9130145.1 hypothetical protein [Coleofasciculus sp. LEGE 07081]